MLFTLVIAGPINSVGVSGTAAGGITTLPAGIPSTLILPSPPFPPLPDGPVPPSPFLASNVADVNVTLIDCNTIVPPLPPPPPEPSDSVALPVPQQSAFPPLPPSASNVPVIVIFPLL